MTRVMTIDDLTNLCTHHGLSIIEITPMNLHGAYVHDLKLILLNANLTTKHKLAALAHEYVHALRGDDGHQPQTVERLVDRQAAQLLVSDEEYATAENIVGPDPRAIAIELDLPLWLIQAWKPGGESGGW